MPRRILSDTPYVMRMLRGITYTRKYTQTTKTGIPINLTGKEIQMTFKDVFGNTLTFSTSTGVGTTGHSLQFISAPAGTFRLIIPAAMTEIAENGRGWMVLIDGLDVTPLWTGEVKVIDP